MNNLLVAAEKWFNELEIKTAMFPNCLKVDRKDVENWGGKAEVLSSLRVSIGNNKVLWANEDTTHYFMEAF